MALVPLASAIAMHGHLAPAQALTILATIFAAIVAVGAFLLYGVRTGRFSHVDVSRREERGAFFAAALVATAAATGFLYFTHAPAAAVFGVGISFALILVASAVNRRIKASLHTAFAILAAAVVGPEHPLLLTAFGGMAAAVAWSRLALGRHDRAEVVVGAVLGCLAAGALEWARRTIH